MLQPPERTLWSRVMAAYICKQHVTPCAKAMNAHVPPARTTRSTSLVYNRFSTDCPVAAVYLSRRHVALSPRIKRLIRGAIRPGPRTMECEHPEHANRPNDYTHRRRSVIHRWRWWWRRRRRVVVGWRLRAVVLNDFRARHRGSKTDKSERDADDKRFSHFPALLFV